MHQATGAVPPRMIPSLNAEKDPLTLLFWKSSVLALEEWKKLMQMEKHARYNVVQDYIEEQVRGQGYRYVDTMKLDLDLGTADFRNADHVYPVVLVDVTPVVLDSCFGESSTSQ